MLFNPSNQYKKWLALTMLLLIWFAPLAQAQNSTSGTLVGQVLDEAKQPVFKALVTLTNLENGNTASTRSNEEGNYRFEFKPSGIYKVMAEKDGYSNGEIESFVVQLNKTNWLKLPDITLRRLAAPQPNQPTAPPIITPAISENLIGAFKPLRGGNISPRELELLPVGGGTPQRSFDEYAFLFPGVAPPPFTPGVRGPGVGFGIGTAGEFAVNGLRARSNNFTVDGSDNNDPDVGVRRQGFVALAPQSIESIQDFHISTLLWDAEQGRNVGSLVNAVSRDGGNSIRGQVYGFFTDSALNARNFFNRTGFADADPFTRTQAGIVLGAPIRRDRTHLFGSFEYLHIRQSLEQHFAVPRLDERRFLNLPQLRVENFTVADGFTPNDAFNSADGKSPLGRRVLGFYPLPNNSGGPFGDNTFSQVLSSDGDGVVTSVKLNHQFAAGRVFNARYNFTDDNRLLPSVNRAINSSIKADTRTHNLSLIYESQYSDTLANQARFSYGRTKLDLTLLSDIRNTFSSAGNETVNVFGRDVIFRSQTGEIGELLIQPFSPVGVNAFLFPQDRVSNTFQFADSLSWTLRNHAVKFGADVRRVQLNSRLDRNYRPQVVYGNGILNTGTITDLGNFRSRFDRQTTQALSGIQLANLGLPSSIFQTITRDTPDSTVGLRFSEFNFFVSDNWRVNRKLTLDFGLRYEYNTVPREVNNRIEDAIGLQNVPAQGNSFANSPERTRAFNNAVAAYQRFLDGRQRIYEPDGNNFGGRVGFAFIPDAAGNLVIRGGYGIYYDAILGAVVTQSRNVFPNEIPVNIEPSFLRFDVFTLNSPSFLVIRDPNGRRADIPLIASNTLNQFGGSSADFVALIGQLFLQNSLGGGLAFTLPEKNLQTPYAQQWHLTLEREFFNNFAISAAYVGSKGTKLTRLTTPNLGPNVTPSIALYTRVTNLPPGFPQPPPTVLGDCALQTFNNGKCSLQPNRPIPALGAIQVFENAASSIYHALQLEMRKRYARGFTLTTAYTYSKAIDEVSDVFPIAGAPIVAQDSFNLRAERGNASFDVRHLFSASATWDLPFFKDGDNAVNRLLGGWQLGGFLQAHGGQPFTLLVPFDANLDGNLTDRPATTEGLTFVDGHNAQKITVAGNRAVTDFFALGQSGFVGRNTVRGDGYVNVDLALHKSFVFSERQKLSFRVESFNLLNRANFGLPIGAIGAPGFGRAVETANPARTIQFALKYAF